jgi:hypothetical protein
MSAALDLTSGEPEIGELRRLLASSPLLPYEQWNGSPVTTILGNAQRVLREGWARSNHPALALDGPLPWDQFPEQSRSWNFLLNCFDLLDTLLSAHSATGDAQYLRPAVRVALDWIEKHPVVDSNQGAHAWYDMAVGMRAYRLAYILDAGAREPWLDDAQLDALRGSLELHRLELADDTKIAFHSNHGFYQIAGQLAMARRFGASSEKMRAARDQANARMLAIIDRQFSAEGVHKEHSPDYHRMVADTLKGIVDAGLLESAEAIAREEQIERSLAWFIMPNGYIVNFGDSDYRLCTRSVRDAVAKWRTPEMRAAVTLGEVGAREESAHRAFAESGYFVVKSKPRPGEKHADAGYLAQIAAFHSRTHKHADDLSFVWYDRGALLLVDSGRYGYFGKVEKGSPLWQEGFWYSDPNRVYCESTRAHNTVEIDGRNYPRKGVKPYGSALDRSGSLRDEVFFSECEVKHFKSIRHVRLLIFKPSAWLVVCDWLHDNLEVPHEYRQWFHFEPELSVRRDGQQYVATGARPEQSLRAVSLLSGATCGKTYLARDAAPMQGFWSPSDRTMLPSYAVAFEQTARTGLFATLFTFAEQLTPHPSSRINPSGRNGQLRWRSDGRDHLLAFSRPEEGSLSLNYEDQGD